MVQLIQYFLFRIVCWWAQSLSFQSAHKVGSALGRAVFSLTEIRKEVTLDNLRWAFPERTTGELRLIAKKAYENYGIAIIEFLWASNKSLEEIKRVVRVENPEVFTNAVGKGKGLIYLGAHYGSWEFHIPGPFAHFGVPIASVVQRQRNARVDAVIDSIRTRFGNSTIPMGVASRGVLTALAQKKMIVMLGDQSGSKEAEFVHFFGRPAATHRGAAAFALKSGAPIVMSFIIRQDDGTHVMKFEEVDQSGLDRSSKESVLELTRRHVAVLEKWIRKHPDHWLWMHKRWKHTEEFERQPQLVETA